MAASTKKIEIQTKLYNNTEKTPLNLNAKPDRKPEDDRCDTTMDAEGLFLPW